jgi:DNA modification methylase
MLNQIITGDARELAKDIPDESCNLVFTDPVYENIEDYKWLAQTALRILKPNSACLAWVSTRQAAYAQLAMEETGLTYQWTLQYASLGKNAVIHLYGLLPKTTPLLYFTKGRRKAIPYIPDIIINNDPPDFKKDNKNFFGWQKNQSILKRYLETFSKPGDVIYDPFSGSGSLEVVCKQAGRNFYASEIEPDRAEIGRARLTLTQMPLFVIEPSEEQQRMVI